MDIRHFFNRPKPLNMEDACKATEQTFGKSFMSWFHDNRDAYADGDDEMDDMTEDFRNHFHGEIEHKIIVDVKKRFPHKLHLIKYWGRMKAIEERKYRYYEVWTLTCADKDLYKAFYYMREECISEWEGGGYF